MTTKQQEREALAKIRKIVEDLGESSYLKSAFDGAFEIAEQNIYFDWAINALDSGRRQGRDEAKKEIDALKTQLAEAERLSKYNVRTAGEWQNEATTLRATNNILEVKNEKLQTEVIKLKARLFDLIDKEFEQGE